MVFLFSKEASAVRKATPNPSCIKSANLKSSPSNSGVDCDELANPILPSPQNFGWTADENGWMPVMTKLRIPPTPDAISYLPCKVVLMLQEEKLKKTLPV